MPILIKQVSWQEASKQLKAIRKIVFLIEQNVPQKEEWDGRDDNSNTLHYLLTLNSIPTGTARVLLDNNTAKIGRVAILKEQRGKGFATQLMRQIIKDLKASGIQTITLDSQIYICNLYEKLGFIKTGDIFMDAGIEHQKMILQL
jgi:predicted GNAT family N-acyltransferase